MAGPLCKQVVLQPQGHARPLELLMSPSTRVPLPAGPSPGALHIRLQSTASGKLSLTRGCQYSL